jgi:NAD(P)-dependent dehydrogenase (short-subunit alcohol dehydrogenase family)
MILDKFKLEGKVAIVTGASAGLGKASPPRWRRRAQTSLAWRAGNARARAKKWIRPPQVP